MKRIGNMLQADRSNVRMLWQPERASRFNSA